MAIIPSTTIDFGGKKYSGRELTSDEEKLLFHQVLDVLPAGNSFLAETFRMQRDSIKFAAEIAKEKLDAPFKGMLAADPEIGIQLIRPGHILRTTSTTETASNTWSVSFSAGAAGAWIGFGTLNATAVNIDKQVLLLAVGVAFTQGVTPVVEEIYIQVGETVYPVMVIRHAWFADNPNRVRACRFHPILMEPKQTVIGQTYCIAAATNELMLLGLAFGYGRYLRKTSYSSISL